MIFGNILERRAHSRPWMPRISIRSGVVGASGSYHDDVEVRVDAWLEVFWGGLIPEGIVKLSENIYRL